MIYIKKGKEPASLTVYKKQKYVYFDGYDKKDDIREQLLKDQGYLCAYCMRRIDIKHMKIEHWYPENLLTDLETLDYKNMLGCCEGHIDGTRGSDDTCDTRKGYQKIQVNPLDRSTLESIQYRSATGEIYSENEEIEKDINDTLNLNSEAHMLKLNRKHLLSQVIMNLSSQQKNGIWKKSVLEKAKAIYEGKDAAGMKREYAGIALWYIDKKLKTVKK